MARRIGPPSVRSRAVASSDEARQQRLDFRLPGRQVLGAVGRDRERLARAARSSLFDVAHLVEHGQRRIDDAGAGHIEAAAQLLDRPDQLVAVPRLVGDQLEQDEAKLAGIEDPTAPAAPPVLGLTPAAAAKAATTAAASGPEMMMMPVRVPAMMVM